jgi:hypothetical protein
MRIFPECVAFERGWGRTDAVSLACLALTFFVSGLVVAQDNAVDTSAKTIKRKTLRTINEIVLPAVESGNDAAFLSAMTPIVSRATQDQLNAIEAYCKTEGCESVQGHFADLVLRQVEQGAIDSSTKLEMSVALYLANALADKIESGLQAIGQHPVMKDPLSVSNDWEETEKLFWEVHVYKNEFINAQRLVDFGVAVLKPHLRRVEKSEEAHKIKTVERIADLSKQVPETYTAMVEREAEMRLIRFRQSHQQLHGQGDFESLLTAAMSVELDAEKLTELFRQYPPGSFSRVALNDPKLPATIVTMVKTGREVGDSISLKANLFRSGLHYWLRGRYGEGPMAFGLLKSPDAMKSQLAMEGLYMPKARPNPISDYHGANDSQAGYDRRHYYTWAVEYRPLVKSLSYQNDPTSQTEVTTTGIKKVGQFW